MMIVHGAMAGREFLLWAEISEPNAAIPSAPRSRRKAKAVTSAAVPTPAASAPLAFGATAALMKAALGEVGGAPAASEGEIRLATVWLPTIDGQPLASSSLVAPVPEPDAIRPAKPTLAPWRIEALQVPISRVLDLLGSADTELLAPGVLWGRDLLFWVQALRLAGALVTRQQFLPGLRRESEGYRAVWEPVISGVDLHRLARLARAMPHACRAVTLDEQITGATPVAAQDALSGFIGAVVDHLVRSRPQLNATCRTRPVYDSLHDAWLYALTSPEGRVHADVAELSLLATHLEEWRRPIHVLETSPWRLCFRLDEPPTEGEVDSVAHGVAESMENGATASNGATAPSDNWQLAYLLQARDDPSLLIPAAQAWALKGAGAAALRQKGFNAREYLLTALGQAAALCPPVEAGLKGSAPSGHRLDAAGAHEFLTRQATMLEQAGFGVFLPSWWARKNSNLHLSAHAKIKSPRRPKMQGGSGLSLDQIVKFEWEVALGGERLTLRELESLARLKAPLVRFRGQWVQLSGDEIKAALNFWKKRAAPQASLRELLRMALGVSGSGPLPVEGVAASGWIGELLDQLQGGAKFEEALPPAGFRGQLRPYQIRGYSWLGFLRRWGLGACLADDMGLGKTPTTLAFLQSQREAGELRPSLLVCPTSVLTNWQKEAARFTPQLPVLMHHGVGRGKGPAFQEQAAKHAVVLSSYALLHRDFEVFKEVEWAGVILDEAQNIKNPETRQSKAARSLSSQWRIALTGTPVENNVGDLWSVMEFLNAGFLGGQSEFKRRFFVPIQTESDPDAGRHLQRLTTPFILSWVNTPQLAAYREAHSASGAQRDFHLQQACP